MACSGSRHDTLYRVRTVPIDEGYFVYTSLICKSCNCTTEDFTILREKHGLSNPASKRSKKSQGDNNAALYSNVRSNSARDT